MSVFRFIAESFGDLYPSFVPQESESHGMDTNRLDRSLMPDTGEELTLEEGPNYEVAEEWDDDDDYWDDDDVEDYPGNKLKPKFDDDDPEKPKHSKKKRRTGRDRRGHQWLDFDED